MRNHIHRVLSEHHLTPVQWAILSTANFYLPGPVEQFVIEAQLESEENFTIDQLQEALSECLHSGWISTAGQTRTYQSDIESSTEFQEHLQGGIVLTDAGHQLKETVSQAIMETVEID